MSYYTLLPHVNYSGSGISSHKEPASGIPPTGSLYHVDYVTRALEHPSSLLLINREERKRAWLNRLVYFSRPIPYLVQVATVSPATESSNPLSVGAGHYCDFTYTSNETSLIYNRAYQRFVDKCRQSVDMGEFVGELGKTWASLEKPLTFLRGLVSAVQSSKRDPKQLLGVLLSPVSPPRTPRFQKGSRNKRTGRQRWRDSERSKRRHDFLRKTHDKKLVVSQREADIAGLWLEYTYGLGAALESVYDAAVIIRDSIPPYGRVSASSSGTVDLNSVEGRWTHTGNMKVSFRLRADVSVSNPLTYTLEQFGVINPALIAWNLMPFSFLVDWIVNVGEMLGTVSDFAGLRLTDPFVTQKRVGQTHSTYDEGPPWGITHVMTVESKSFRRSLGIPSPTLVVKYNALESVKRALNAIALVTSIGHSALHNQPFRGKVR